MAIQRLTITKNWLTGTVVREINWDNVRDPLITWSDFMVNDVDQLRIDTHGSTYSLDNDGLSNLAGPIRQWDTGVSTLAWTFSGAVTFSGTFTLNSTLTLDQDSNAVSILLNNAAQTTAHVLSVTNADSLTTGSILNLVSNSADVGVRSIIRAVNDNAAATGATLLNLQQDAAQRVVFIDQNADALSISIDSESTSVDIIDFLAPVITTGICLDISGVDALTTGSIARFLSNSADASARNLVSITNDNAAAAASVCLFLDQDADAIAINIDTESTTDNGLDIQADALTTGSIARFYSNSADLGARNLVNIVNDNAAATSAICLNIQQDTGTRALAIDQNGDGSSLYIDSEATATAVILVDTPTTSTASVLNIDSCNSLTTGFIARFHSNSADVGVRSLVSVINDNAAATSATCLTLQQDAAIRALFIDQNANAESIIIDSEATGGNVIDITAPTTDAGFIFDVNDADALTTGGFLRLISNSASVGVRNLVNIVNDNLAATGTTVIRLQQDSASACCVISHSPASSSAIFIDVANGGYADNIILADCDRAANSAYSFFAGTSGNSADTEVRLRGDGEVQGDAAAYVTPAADYAEMFECEDPNGIEAGYFVTYAGDLSSKVKVAKKEDDILGVVSGHPACLADDAWGRWAKKYLFDEFNRYLLDERGNRILNPNFDSSKEYVPRRDRKEWVPVGLLGKLNVRTSEDINSNYIDVDNKGMAKNGKTYRVIEVVRQKSEGNKGYGVVKVVLK